ncbi:hypothetical protein [Corynebacterium belfantii]|uniref:Gram-positive cocci surface proteins LPxTG domain-containing protein n=1 Tax=Corynebacterium belfantii TaxID=2014537 RepID=A0ABS0LEM7_9CORY|nr:hypothetical protein [Corynebacterium belfantii]OLN14789.1 hypothetical protein BUE64_11065 [Corynebacterium diphtheriae subsp. lausannense]MBG9243636.1 hypothetical protein [Corynebacterium belfantii]MBG9288024.1 hypothetical protein [Corynebacterium belfantii]MBG9311136.1 hypothetical protein [Corynebacterium belfantii]MBG9330598.1 hypothetical protein [Corynebacterium belfantii]
MTNKERAVSGAELNSLELEKAKEIEALIRKDITFRHYMGEKFEDVYNQCPKPEENASGSSALPAVAGTAAVAVAAGALSQGSSVGAPAAVSKTPEAQAPAAGQKAQASRGMLAHTGSNVTAKTVFALMVLAVVDAAAFVARRKFVV